MLHVRVLGTVKCIRRYLLRKASVSRKILIGKMRQKVTV
jgi:hypothetical protein